MALVNHVRISGLNGHKTVDVPIRHQHCIFVGPNGSGKSTALQILSYALGRQWRELSRLRFQTLELTFSDDKTVKLERSSCEKFLASSGPSRYSRYHSRLTSLEILDNFISADLQSPSTIEYFSEILGLPPVEMRGMQRHLKGQARDKQAQREVNEFQAALEAAGIPLILYLPTYRRIELELNKAFENIPEPYRRYISADIEGRPTSKFIRELVRFGMEDVSGSIQSFERETRDYARSRFNRMMTSYLKEMANSQAVSVSDLRSLNISKDTVNVVLSRIEEGLLSETEKSQISDIILELSGGRAVGNPTFNKKWLAQFFVRLLEVNRDIEARERPIRSLESVLNRYLDPKRISYDIESYHLSIIGEAGRELALADLSSGEKQLFSILNQVFFPQQPLVNVMIDEPELSLSVPWQSDFLVDIASAPATNQIFAVTHSPFVYDNSLSRCVVDFVDACEAE